MKYKKVTGKKKVTSNFAKEILKGKYDTDYVEFHKDYCKEHPSTKIYRDTITGDEIAVIGRLPRVDKQGNRIVAKFNYQDSKYIIDNNLFECEVDGEQVTVRHEGKECIYTPQLFLDGILQTFYNPIIKSTLDYENNVIEFNSPKATRRIRIFEGSYREEWIINEKADIEVKHNFTGDNLINIGTGHDVSMKPIDVKVSGDSELFSGDADYPVTICGFSLYYVTTNSVDGSVGQGSLSGDTFSNLVNGSGDSSGDTGGLASLCKINSNATTNLWDDIDRGVILFDTNTLDYDKNIYNANISLYIYSVIQDTLNCKPDIGIYETAPASDTALVDADYATFGSLLLSNEIAYDDIVVSSYNSWNLNAAGRSKINREDITKFGTRSNYDATNTAPSWVASSTLNISYRPSEFGTSTEPRLTVFYRNLTEYIKLESGYLEVIELTSGVDLE